MISFSQEFTKLLRSMEHGHGLLKDKSGLDKIIAKKQPYQLLNTSLEFFQSFDASNVHKLVNESWYVRPHIIAILYFVFVCEGAIRRLAMLVV